MLGFFAFDIDDFGRYVGTFACDATQFGSFLL